MAIFTNKFLVKSVDLLMKNNTFSIKVFLYLKNYVLCNKSILILEKQMWVFRLKYDTFGEKKNLCGEDEGREENVLKMKKNILFVKNSTLCSEYEGCVCGGD